MAVSSSSRAREGATSLPARAGRRRRLRDAWDARSAALGWQLAAGAMLALMLRAGFVRSAPAIDEGGYAAIAQQWHLHGSSLYGEMWLDRPPLVLALMKGAISSATALGFEPMAGVRALGAAAALLLVASCVLAARRIAGAAAGMPAGLVAASLASSIAIEGVYTNGELLAASINAAAVACGVAGLVAPAGRRRVPAWAWLAAAGCLAACAGLVKQSFVDAAAALVIACLATAPAAAGTGARRACIARAAGRTGVVVAAGFGTLGATVLVTRALGISTSDLVDAVWHFRTAALRAIRAGSAHAAVLRFAGLSSLFFATVMGPLLLASLFGVWHLRRRVGLPVAVLLWAWAMIGLATIAFGGSFWRHYLLQLAPVTAIAAGVAITLRPGRRDRLLTVQDLAVALVALGAACTLVTVAWRIDRPYHQSDVTTGQIVRESARPGDTMLVLYARASVLETSGLPTLYPYAWSLMVRARPGATAELRQLLASPGRPTFIVAWQQPTAWKLDRSGRTAALLAAHYRVARHVCDHDILVRSDVSRPLAAVPERCAQHLHLGPLPIDD